jgi:hypothetical protein
MLGISTISQRWISGSVRSGFFGGPLFVALTMMVDAAMAGLSVLRT